MDFRLGIKRRLHMVRRCRPGLYIGGLGEAGVKRLSLWREEKLGRGEVRLTVWIVAFTILRRPD